MDFVRTEARRLARAYIIAALDGKAKLYSAAEIDKAATKLLRSPQGREIYLQAVREAEAIRRVA